MGNRQNAPSPQSGTPPRVPQTPAGKPASVEAEPPSATDEPPASLFGDTPESGVGFDPASAGGVDPASESGVTPLSTETPLSNTGFDPASFAGSIGSGHAVTIPTTEARIRRRIGVLSIPDADYSGLFGLSPLLSETLTFMGWLSL